MKRAHRVDGPQKQIVAALRKVGASVLDLSGVGGGAPDLLVGYRYQNILLEVKAPGESQRENQVEWSDGWNGDPVYVVQTVSNALVAIGALSA
jgi:lambda repressor-like predicted transcriptional regulator